MRPSRRVARVPTELPTFLAQVVDHFNGVEVARHREVQHADKETGDREREVSIDRELLRNELINTLEFSTSGGGGKPNRHDKDPDREKRRSHLIGSDVLHRVNALQQIEEEPIDRRKRQQTFAAKSVLG